MLEDTFCCWTPEAPPATPKCFICQGYTLNVCVRVTVCVCVRMSGSDTVIEACKYSSQLSPPAPVPQGLQAVRSRLREEALSEYRCCQRRAQQHTHSTNP